LTREARDVLILYVDRLGIEMVTPAGWIVCAALAVYDTLTQFGNVLSGRRPGSPADRVRYHEAVRT